AFLSAAAFVAGLFVNPPYGFAPEDNLAYAHVIRMHQAAIGQLKKLYPGATVLTAWPMTDELTKPELGYVKEPWDVCAIDNFSADEIARAAAEPEKYSVALAFSTKYEPPPLLPQLSGELLAERYFGLHHDLPPEVIAQRLDGTPVWMWKRNQGTMWVALIRFNRQIEARIEKPIPGF
ncbi:MAG: glycosyltransferase, partial [Terracidiphilus sp.]